MTKLNILPQSKGLHLSCLIDSEIPEGLFPKSNSTPEKSLLGKRQGWCQRRITVFALKSIHYLEAQKMEYLNCSYVKTSAGYSVYSCLVSNQVEDRKCPGLGRSSQGHVRESLECQDSDYKVRKGTERRGCAARWADGHEAEIPSFWSWEGAEWQKEGVANTGE